MVQNRRAADSIPPGDSDRRRYNRRAGAGDPSPPYFDVFERIAIALEGIRDALPQQVTLPGSRSRVRNEGAEGPGRDMPAPRRS